MIKMIVAFVFSTLLVGVLSYEGCPHGFIHWDREDTCYLISDIPATRYDAQMYCKAFDSNLVSIESEMENYFLKYSIKNKLMNGPGDYTTRKMKFLKGMGSYWTAGIHKRGTNQWMWQACEQGEAEPMNYTYWANHQPNASITYAYDGMITAAMKSWKHSMYAKMYGQKNHGHSHGHGPGHNHVQHGKMSQWKKSTNGKYDDKANAEKRSKYGNYQQKQQGPPAYAEPTYNHGRRGKRSYPQSWNSPNTQYQTTYQTNRNDDDSSSSEDQPRRYHGHYPTKTRRTPDLRGDNCTVIRKCMADHNITWYSVPCDVQGIRRFFICEKPSAMANLEDDDVYEDLDGEDYDDEDFDEDDAEGKPEDGEPEDEHASYSYLQG